MKNSSMHNAILRYACATVALTGMFAPAAMAQATHARASQAQPQQAQPWTKIPIPPLPAFHPQQPKRIVLANGLTIFLQEDHELPLIDGFVLIRGGSSDEPASKAGMLDLYSQAWRTSGTAKLNGDQMDDILEAKAAKIETANDDDSTSLTWSCLSRAAGSQRLREVSAPWPRSQSRR